MCAIALKGLSKIFERKSVIYLQFKYKLNLITNELTKFELLTAGGNGGIDFEFAILLS